MILIVRCVLVKHITGLEGHKTDKENLMDKKIKKILISEKKAVRGTKELLKMDKKQDKKLEQCGKEMKMKMKKR
jgi:hypothetical protein